MITIPNKYGIPRDEWVAIRVQLMVLGCPSKALPKRYTTFRHRLAVITHYNFYLRDTLAYPRHLGWFAHWLNDNSLAVTHYTHPDRYHIGRDS